MGKRKSIRNRKLLTLNVAVSDPRGMSLPKPPESGEIPAPPTLPEIDTQRGLPPWGLPPPGAVVGVDRALRTSISTRLTGIVGLSLSAKHLGQRGDTAADPLGPLLRVPLPPPAGSTPCPCPPRYFPCPLTREDRKKLDAAEPVIRRLQAEMDAPENLGEIERLVARVQAGEAAPLVATWLEQRMEEAGLADDERQLVRLLFHDRPDLAEIPGSAIVFTRRDPTTGEDLGPALVPTADLLP